MVHPLAGQPAPASMLVDLAALERAYYDGHPDPAVAEQRVSFGTSGHRGSSLRMSFNEDHILAITQAICEYRASRDVTGPLYVGVDTHALSAPAQRSALEVLVACGVDAVVASDDAYTPPHGGPADTDATKWIEDRANALLAEGVGRVKRASPAAVARAVHAEDFI